jgi:hypothetical protein
MNNIQVPSTEATVPPAMDLYTVQPGQRFQHRNRNAGSGQSPCDAPNTDAARDGSEFSDAL